jgi:hypothetical protein
MNATLGTLERFTKDDFLNTAMFLILYLVVFILIIIGTVIGIKYISSIETFYSPPRYLSSVYLPNMVNVRPFQERD